MSKTVSFTEKDIKNYLDTCIKHWRKKREQEIHDRSVPLEANQHHGPEMAVYYIDAFQSVRISLFGELLPQNENE